MADEETKEAEVIPAGFLKAGPIRPTVKDEEKEDETPSPTQAEVDASSSAKSPMRR